MGRIILQMMISLDGMVSGPHGELDWLAIDVPLNLAHKTILEQAGTAILGAGAYPEMSSYWMAAEKDEKADALVRDFGRAMNEVPKIIYSHNTMPVSWRNAKIHVVKDDNALAQDVHRLKKETEGTILVYGGVRMARTFIQQDLLDEIHLDICPVILGTGQPLFTDLTHRTTLRLRQAITYATDASEMIYEVVKAS